jgi:hypothetical protein
MRIADVLDQHLDGISVVVDTTSERALDLRPYVQVPAGVDHHVSVPAAEAVHGAGSLVLSLIGPDDERHAPLELFGDVVLPALAPGARGVLLLGWCLDDVPAHQLVALLVAHQCQVHEIVPLDYEHISAAVVFDRVETVGQMHRYLATAGDDGTSLDGLQPQLRLINEYLFTDLAARLARTRWEAAEQGLSDAKAADNAPRRDAVGAKQLDELRRVNRRLTAERERLDAEVARTRARLVALETSTAYQIGVTLAHARRAPTREGVKLPSRIWRLYRDRVAGSATTSPPARPAAAVDGPQPLEAAEQALLSGITATFARKERLAVAGVLREETAASLDPDVDLLRLRPNTAALLFERCQADVLLVESAAARPGQPWAYAGTPAGSVRDADLMVLLDRARSRDIPVVFWWTSEPYENPGLQRFADDCDLVAAAPSLRAEGAWLPLSRGVQLRRFNPLGGDPHRQGIVHVGSLDRRTPRAAVEPLLDYLRSARQHDLEIYGDFSPYVQGAPSACGYPPDLEPAVVSDRSWREWPSLYRQAAAALASNSSWSRPNGGTWDVRDAEKLACGTVLIHPCADRAPSALRETGVIVDPSGLDPAGLTPADTVTTWLVLRDLFTTAATAVELDRLVRALNIRRSPLDARTVSVVVVLSASTPCGELVASVLNQRHRPVELVVVVESSAMADAAQYTLSELEQSGVPVHTVAEPSGADWSAVVATVRGEWVTCWGQRDVHDANQLLDLLVGAEMTGASIVGRSEQPDPGYVSSLRLRDAMVKRSVVTDREGQRLPLDPSAELAGLAPAGQLMFTVPLLSDYMKAPAS